MKYVAPPHASAGLAGISQRPTESPCCRPSSSTRVPANRACFERSGGLERSRWLWTASYSAGPNGGLFLDTSAHSRGVKLTTITRTSEDGRRSSTQEIIASRAPRTAGSGGLPPIPLNRPIRKAPAREGRDVFGHSCEVATGHPTRMASAFGRIRSGPS